MVRIFFTTFDTVCTLGSYFGVFFDLVYIKLKVKRTQNTDRKQTLHTHTHIQLQFPGSRGVSPSSWCLLVEWMGCLHVNLPCWCVFMCVRALVPERRQQCTDNTTYTRVWTKVIICITHLQPLIKLFAPEGKSSRRAVREGQLSKRLMFLPSTKSLKIKQRPNDVPKTSVQV